ncbi:MAG: AarF/UbiB family protein, partial [Ilumatobacteraceae bacterium]
MSTQRPESAPKRLVALGVVALVLFGALSTRMWFLQAVGSRNVEEVIVKVIRPGIEKVIEEDLKLMMTIAKFVEKNFVDGKRLKLVQVVSDYRMTILDELDLM